MAKKLGYDNLFRCHNEWTYETSGLKEPPKYPTIIHDIKLGKPFVVLEKGRNFVRRTRSAGGRGIGKKRKITCNG